MFYAESPRAAHEASVRGKAARGARLTANSIALALGTVVMLAAAGCGEDAPPPEVATPVPTVEAAALSPTARPDAPATATPTATPTTTPTPTPRPTVTPAPTPRPTQTASTGASVGPTADRTDALGFSASRFEDALERVAENATRVSGEIGPGHFTLAVETQPADDAMRVLITDRSSGRPISIEMLRVDTTIFVRGHDANGNWIPWLGSNVAADLALPLGVAGLAIEGLESLGITDDEPGYSVVGKVRCPDGRSCFLLQLPDFGEGHHMHLMVDTETYLPVLLRLQLKGVSSFFTDMFFEWNADVAIAAPPDAQMLTPEEFAVAGSRLISERLGTVDDPGLPDAAAMRGRKAAVLEVFWLVPELGALLDKWARDGSRDLFSIEAPSGHGRYDSTVDISTWGAGVIDLGDSRARELFGPDGTLACGSEYPVVACGADDVAPGPYLVVWIALIGESPVDDDAGVRTFWVLLEDGDPVNDFMVLPEFVADVLFGSDQHYRIEAAPDGWRFVRTLGPWERAAPTDGAAIVLEAIVLFWVPVSELGDLEALSLGVASFSGPAVNPFGVGATFDRSPDPGQPLTPLKEVGI